MQMPVLLLGPEGSGKSTMVKQLRAISCEAALLDVVAVQPTTGVETDVIPLAPPMTPEELEAEVGTTKKQEIAQLAGGKARGHRSGESRGVVQVKEVGGRMAAVWPKFVEKFLADAAAVARATGGDNAAAGHGPADNLVPVFVFVVDASAPHTVPLMAVEMMNLFARFSTSSDLFCRSPSAIVINKVRMPSAIDPEVLLDLLPLDSLNAARSAGAAHKKDGGVGHRGSAASRASPPVSVFVVDTWAGDGMLALWNWIVGLSS